MKSKLIVGILTVAALFSVSGCQKGVEKEVYQKLKEDYEGLEGIVDDVRKENEKYLQQYEDLEKEYETLEEEYDALKEQFEDQTDSIEELETAYNALLAERDGLNYELQNYQTYIQGVEAYVREQQLREYAQSFKEDITYEELQDHSEEYLGEKIKMQGIVQETNVTEEAFELLVAIGGDDAKPMLFSGAPDWVQGNYEAGREIILYAEAAGLYEFSQEEWDGETVADTGETEEDAVQMIPKAVFEYIM